MDKLICDDIYHIVEDCIESKIQSEIKENEENNHINFDDWDIIEEEQVNQDNLDYFIDENKNDIPKISYFNIIKKIFYILTSDKMHLLLFIYQNKYKIMLIIHVLKYLII